MAKAESYNDLIFQLGDLARERLASRPQPPRSMNRVLRAEEVLLARQEELAELEQQMNDAEEAFHTFQAEQAAEAERLKVVVKQWRKAVDGIEGKVRELRKRLTGKRAELRYAQDGLKKAERRHADFELGAPDPAKLELSRQNLKKLRLATMRLAREVDEMGRDVSLALTPRPGQPGAQGILAHKRLLEMEDEAEARRLEHEATMAELDRVIGAKEEEVQAAEDYLDQTLFLLGEECYTQRVPDASLAPLYPRLDRAE
jgi:DNA repair exonuclease SbcCD ATPase subunit